ncbi:MAG: hypothetical protein OEV14_04025 [Gammaproteobacteria bacterium]|nr:hypothetical protein [Gammaproteobacteria bacterium]
MPEIDLIPADYRHDRWLRQWLRGLGVVAVAVLVFNLAAYSGFNWRLTRLAAEVVSLEQQRAVTEQQRLDLEALTQQQFVLNRQLKVLSSLRSGGPAREVFRTIDEAMAEADIWFLDWQFRRAGVVVPDEQVAGVQTGYFIVTPDSGSRPEDSSWLVQTHMTIRGQARDHQALSKFVNGLYAQPAVVDVSVQRTELKKLAASDVVQFDLAVVLNSEARG